MPNETTGLPPVEVVPTSRGQLSAIASAHAPWIYFDEASTFGVTRDGIVNITLTAARQMLGPDNKPIYDVAVTAHLRMGRAAFATFKEAVAKLDLMLQPPASAEKN